MASTVASGQVCRMIPAMKVPWLEHDAGDLGIGHVVTDADGLAVDGRADDSTVLEPAVPPQAGVEHGHDRWTGVSRGTLRSRGPPEPHHRYSAAEGGLVRRRRARPLEVQGTGGRSLEVQGAVEARALEVEDPFDADLGRRAQGDQVVEPHLDR